MEEEDLDTPGAQDFLPSDFMPSAFVVTGVEVVSKAATKAAEASANEVEPSRGAEEMEGSRCHGAHDDWGFVSSSKARTPGPDKAAGRAVRPSRGTNMRTCGRSFVPNSRRGTAARTARGSRRAISRRRGRAETQSKEDAHSSRAREWRIIAARECCGGARLRCADFAASTKTILNEQNGVQEESCVHL